MVGLFMCMLIQCLGFMVLLLLGFFVCECFSMIVWTPAVLSVLHGVLYFCILHLFSTIEHASHGKAL